ncbi:unnamed protein product [Tuber melanosporum]|uniref:(Perigord truffle) hypothetical protein n=1 Tax=Tuber melanosporum (strain Mel28) TaxID=656061 RepID=D5GK26_TUBMM|nr:uncharacterized protein GSTUM_00009333001 [Tuber melanosporum]CAZ84869.1 unnamed protein product [Tuber melanosporum]
MSAVVTELENALQAMQATKAPGVSGTKINQITELSLRNVQSESVIIQKVYTHFKKCPGTHKLGPLYVVDSIARKYLEQAKRLHEPVSHAAPDGTFGAGVHRITNLLPALMNDILQNAPPEENKDKIDKLVTIWERSSTFPPEVLADIKQRIAASPMSIVPNARSTTPTGSPPPHLQSLAGQIQNLPVYQPPQAHQNPQSAIPNTQSQNATTTAGILQALAQMAKQNKTAMPPQAPSQQQTPAPVPQYSAPTPQQQPSGMPNLSQSASSLVVSQPQQAQLPMAQMPYTSTPPNQNPNAAIPMMGNQLGGMFLGQPGQGQFPTFPPQPPLPPPIPQQGTAPAGIEQMALLQLLLQHGGMNLPQLTQSFGNLASGQGGPGADLGAVLPAWTQIMNAAQGQNQQDSSRSGDDGYGRGQRNREHYSPPSRSPPRYGRDARRGRSRSRSPNRFDRGSPRSRRDRSRTPPRFSNGKGQAERNVTPTALPKFPKHVEFDPTIGPNNIKVLSRTLFVGGVTITDDELRKLFEKHGYVQSCIVNQEKRHAFIKMLTRQDAVKARQGMETYRADNMTIRTRWGVGYGPRDCSDYQTGISVIPIDRLTDADQRWMVSAEYGGTGGRPLEGGMCVEEPDIEIGQGVSSKAISKRFPTDSGGAKGPRSSHDNTSSTGNASGGNTTQRDPPRTKRNDYSELHDRTGRDSNIGVAPPTPGFGTGLPFPMGMMPPNMPPGYQYPGFPNQR